MDNICNNDLGISNEIWDFYKENGYRELPFELLYPVKDRDYGFLAKLKAILDQYRDNAVCGIYCITNSHTGDFYIGSSVNIDKRLEYHFLELAYGLHHNYKIQLDYKEYGGDCFETEVLWIAPKDTDRNVIFAIEQEYINKHSPTYNIQKNVVYIK